LTYAQNFSFALLQTFGLKLAALCGNVLFLPFGQNSPFLLVRSGIIPSLTQLNPLLFNLLCFDVITPPVFNSLRRGYRD